MTVTKTTSLTTTVLALLNGQFGGSIMVLPLLALQAGWIPILLLVALTVLVNWYSSHIMLLHLGPQKDVGRVVTNHFPNHPVPIFAYNLAAACGLLTACMVYFKLMVIQIEGLFLAGEHSSWNAILNGILMVGWLLLTKRCDVDTHISGYGFFSIAAYFVFLLWAALTSPQTKAKQVREIPWLGSELISFTAVMNNALTIQFIIVPILKSYPDRAKYTTIMTVTFLITMIFYYYINGVGAYAIANRQSRGDLETVENYFSQEGWPVILIQTIYLIHLYSVFPQFVLAAKKRLFHLIDKPETGPKHISKTEAIFFLAVVSLAVTISLLNINIKYIITLNGAFFGFVFCYIIPAVLHLKCAYFGIRPPSPPEMIQEESMTPQEMSSIDMGSPPINIEEECPVDEVQNREGEGQGYCSHRNRNLGTMTAMLGIAGMILIYQLKMLSS